MANMSYCRFQNTAQDLQDCRNNFSDDLEWEEFRARERIVQLAKDIVESYWEEEFEEESYDDEEEDENGMTQSQKETYQEQRAEANE